MPPQLGAAAQPLLSDTQGVAALSTDEATEAQRHQMTNLGSQHSCLPVLGDPLNVPSVGPVSHRRDAKRSRNRGGTRLSLEVLPGTRQMLDKVLLNKSFCPRSFPYWSLASWKGAGRGTRCPRKASEAFCKQPPMSIIQSRYWAIECQR